MQTSRRSARTRAERSSWRGFRAARRTSSREALTRGTEGAPYVARRAAVPTDVGDVCGLFFSSLAHAAHSLRSDEVLSRPRAAVRSTASTDKGEDARREATCG